MGQVRTKPIVVHASLIKRNGAIAVSRTFKGRIPFQLYLKLGAWLYALMDEYPPEKYMLIVHIEPSSDPRAQKLASLLRESGIKIARDIYGVVGEPV